MTAEQIATLGKALEGLSGAQLDVLRLPRAVLQVFEPSQIGTVVGTLMDACIPELPTLLGDGRVVSGITKHEGILGEREGYPDYRHESGLRLELKLLYSARLTQKVTVKNVNPAKDVLMVVVYQLQECDHTADFFSPTILDVGLFPMIDCILARDDRLERGGGRWFGDYETPCVPSRIGMRKLQRGETLDHSAYGRKESEGRHFNEDTNFGKLKRVPYQPLQAFLKKHGASYAAMGYWPAPWAIPRTDGQR